MPKNSLYFFSSTSILNWRYDLQAGVMSAVYFTTGNVTSLWRKLSSEPELRHLVKAIHCKLYIDCQKYRKVGKDNRGHHIRRLYIGMESHDQRTWTVHSKSQFTHSQSRNTHRRYTVLHIFSRCCSLRVRNTIYIFSNSELSSLQQSQGRKRGRCF